MTEAGQRDDFTVLDEESDNDMAGALPQDRAGVANGPAGDIPAKYKFDSAIQISEIIAKKRYPKTLTVANIRKNSKKGIVEYQLKEAKAETGVYYRNGHWFPEKDLHILK